MTGAALISTCLVALAEVHPDIEIAPGVSMPMVNLGGVLTKPSNYSAWLSPAVGGTAVDTALSYGTKVQHQVGVALAKSRLPRDRAFVTTKVPCCPDGAPSHMWFSCDDPDGKNTTLALERDLHELDLDTGVLDPQHFALSSS